MTELFYCDIGTLSPENGRTLTVPEGLLTGSEKYTDKNALTQSLAVRALLGYALRQLGAEEGATLFFTEEGKPRLSGVSAYVSLTHSDSYVAVAIGDSPCGVDTENETAVRHVHQLAKRFLDAETERLVRDAENPQLAFLFAFTRLEATVKQKEGVTLPFAKEHLTPIYYRTTLPLPDGKQAVLTAVGQPPFRTHKVLLADLF